MAKSATRPLLDRRFYITLVVAGLATYLVHESAHWLVGRAVGLDVRFRLNGVIPSGSATAGQLLAMSAAGPAITLLQALLAFVFIRRNASKTAFAFLLWAAFMRIVASGVSVVLPNDEARIGMAVGLGYWTLPAAMSLALCTLAWIGARSFDLRRRDYVLLYLILSTVTAAIVFGDRYLG